MLDSGMNVARLNFSHGNHRSHALMIEKLREAKKQRPGNQCAILLDTKGPEIRTGMLKDHQKATFVKGQNLEIVTDYSIEGDNNRIACSYPGLPTSVKPGDQILIADGALVCKVKEWFEDSVTVEVMNDATLGEKKNMNLPGVRVDLPTLTEQDEWDIVDFGIKNGIDIIAASFIRKASDVEYIRDVLGVRGKYIKIVSKIENQEGLENFDEIMMASDAIMVARGDLGMEIPTEKVFLAQKYMIEKCNSFSKPVIVATQMLESMISNPRPTRAEASDVANAVMDGADWIMLSGETAGGKFPVAAVLMMAKIAAEVENTIDYEALYEELVFRSPILINTNELLAAAWAQAALSLKIDLIIVMTHTGTMANLVSKYRPKQSILAISTSHFVVRQMGLLRGVIGYRIPSFEGVDTLLKTIIKAAKSMGLCTKGQTVITLRSNIETGQDRSSIMEICEIE
jgi:pyruvate kinase